MNEFKLRLYNSFFASQKDLQILKSSRRDFEAYKDSKARTQSKKLTTKNKIINVLFYSALIIVLFHSCKNDPPQDIIIENNSVDSTEVKNGIHLATGLKMDEHLGLIRANCLNCHSAKLITQNRATREGWAQMIDWMQATQGLWDLGVSEDKILDYLATHYAPENTGRRKNLEINAEDWYELKLD